MNWTSKTSFPRSCFGTLVLAGGLLVGCGDDGASAEPARDSGVDSTRDAAAHDESTDDVTTTSANSATSAGPSPDMSGGEPTTSDAAAPTASDGGADESSPPVELDAAAPGAEDAGSTSSGSDADASAPTLGDAAAEAQCGAEGETCCASGGGFGGGQGTCNEGLTCNNPAGNGLANSECVVEVVTEGDAATETACGGEGEICCASGGGFGGGQGTCDEGLTCDNPAGNGLANSECVVEVAPEGDAATEAACGGEGEICCASGGGIGGGQGTCDEGLTCDNPAGNGLTNSECVVEVIPTADAGG